jgi:TP901 family phage tail tape measure protein
MGKNAIKVLQEGNKSLDELNGKLNQTINNVLAINDAALKLGKNFFNIKSPQGLNEALNSNKNIVSQLNVELTQRKALEKALASQLAKNKLVESDLNRELVKQRFETQQLNKSVKEAAILSSHLATEYQKLVVKMNQAGSTIQNLNAKRLQGNKLTKAEAEQLRKSEIAFKRYQQAVLGADASVGRFQRNVGNYPRGLNAAASAARNLAGAMGLLGGAFLVVRVFGDAFRRIRDFDKEMQNMAGILRTTRPELKELETKIIAVAAASIKTSNEVATLATSLLVLGKSKNDVIQLLEPVNNLSIALGATSDETGEFLIQTLNAFGKGSESAAEFADTIAAIRTSTSLDFQKMRDSFQYITPISQILGKDLAYTGAVVGVLADNGLKAESAGRLLATAQIKLATSGKSLQEGLDEINDAYKEGKTGIDLLTIANDLFGKQAAKIGVILATQQDRLAEYDEKIRNAKGSLDDLVNQQLESLDAKLKILNSSWERFILTIEKGDGALSGFFKGALESLTDLLNRFTELERSEGFLDLLKRMGMSMNVYGDALNKAEADGREFQKQYVSMQQEISKYIDTLPLYDEQKAFQKAELTRMTYEQLEAELKRIKAIKEEEDAQNGLNGTNKEGEAINTKTIASLRDLIKLEREKIEGIDISTTQGKEEIKQSQKLINGWQAEIDAILGLNEARKASIEAVAGSLAYMEQEVSKLEEKQSKLAKTSKEYYSQEKAIRKAKEAIKEFKDEVQNLLLELDGVGVLKSVGDFEDSYKRIQDILTKDKPKIDGLDANGANDPVNTEIEAFIDREKRKQESLNETAELEKELKRQQLDLSIEAFNNSVELVNTLFDAKVQKYDDEINKNNDYYAALLDNENLSEQQRSALEAERDRKNLELEKKKREEQRKAAIAAKLAGIVNVIISTAMAATAALAPPPIGLGPLAGAALLPYIIGNGAIQAATIAAQPIPQYEKGKGDYDNYEGSAIWGEKRQEAKISKDGSIEFSPSKIGNHLTHVKKDDIIHPDASKFISSLTDEQLYNDIHKHSIMASLQGQSNTIDSYLIAKSMDRSFEKHTNRMIKALKDSKPKINVHNNNSIGQDLKYLMRKQNSL